MAGVNIHRSVWTRTRKPVNDRNIDRVTDERGEVRFDVPETLYIFRLWARAKGHVPLFAHWEEEDDPEENLPEEFTFRLERGTVIGGIIRDQDRPADPGSDRGGLARPQGQVGTVVLDPTIGWPKATPHRRRTPRGAGRWTTCRRGTTWRSTSRSAIPITSPTRSGALFKRNRAWRCRPFVPGRRRSR